MNRRRPNWIPRPIGPMLWLGPTVFAAVVAAGCAIKPVDTQVELPPKAEPLRGERQVAVVDFQGHHRYRDDATREFKEAVAEGPSHTLVTLEDEARLQALDRKLANNEVVGEIGSQGPDTLISGEVLDPDYRKYVDESEDEECVERNDDGECVKERVVMTYELEERCKVGVHARAAGVADGEIVFEKTIAGTDSSWRSLEGRVPTANPEAVCDDAFHEAVSRMVPWLTTVQQHWTLKFHKVNDSGGTDRAIEAAESSQFYRAREIFEQVVQEPNLKERHRGWARYNLALVHFAQGRFDACLEQIDLGLRHLSGNNRLLRLKSECGLYAE